eukprot:4898965-Pyramimonas_sp.AAC.1
MHVCPIEIDDLGVVGASERPPGGVLGCLGGVIRRRWSLLDRLGGVLGASTGAVLEQITCVWGCFGTILGCLGGFLRASWADVGRSWGPLWTAVNAVTAEKSHMFK